MDAPELRQAAVVDDEDAWGPRQKWGGLVAILTALALWVAPLPLEPQAHRLAAIFAFVVILWVSETLPLAVTALLVAPALVLAGIAKPMDAFAPYADPTLFLFVGGFMIAEAMTRHGLDRRLAHFVVSRPFVGHGRGRVRVAFIATACVLSMWMSNTATTALLMPILLGVVGREHAADGSTRLADSGTLLAMAWACSIGGLGTPVGTPPNLIAMRFIREAGHDFSFMSWVALGAPLAAALCVVLAFAFAWLAPTRDVAPAAMAADGVAPTWSKGERVTALAFGLAVTGWMLPGLLELLGLEVGAVLTKLLPPEAVAIFAASVLYLFRDGPERVLPWRAGVRIDWGTILLFGGGISLGKALFDTGLAKVLSQAFLATTGIDGLWELTAVAVVFTIFFGELCSNTATATMLTPLVIAAATELGVSPLPPALGVGLAASCGFMMPISTGSNALAYGTRRIPLPLMLRTGFVMDLVAAVLVLMALGVAGWILGW